MRASGASAAASKFHVARTNFGSLKALSSFPGSVSALVSLDVESHLVLNGSYLCHAWKVGAASVS